MDGDTDDSFAAAHRHFSAWCFNRAWDLIEKPDRTEAEDRMMVALSQASIFHWSCRSDCTDKNLSVGYWQASRIQALLGNAAEATRHARTSLGYSTDLGPFHRGYAYEALARAARLGGDTATLQAHLDQADPLAAQVIDEHDRRLLMADLAELRASGGNDRK